MTTYYVDPAGRDGNNGTATGTPWKSIEFAIAKTSASDEIILQGSTALAPLSDKYYPDTGGASLDIPTFSNALTVRGDGMQYFWQGIDITHGSERPELIPNSKMDGWVDGTTLHKLSTVGDISESSDIDTRVSGRYVKSLYASTEFDGILHDIFLVAGRTYEFNVIAKIDVTAVNSVWSVSIKNNNTSNYLNFDAGTWGANPIQNWGTPGGDTYEDFSSTYTNTFIPESSQTHEIKNNTNNKSGFDRGNIQLFSVKDTGPNNWTDEGSDVWSLPGVIVNMSTNRLLVTTTADWTANGMLGFEAETTGYALQSTEGAMDAAESSFWFDTSTNELKIHVPSGSTIADFHIEIVTGNPVMRFTSDCVAADFTAGGASKIHATTGMTNGLAATNVHNLNNKDFCWDIDAGSDNQLKGCSAKRSRGTKIATGAPPLGDGFTVRGSSAVKATLTGCEAIETADEGFENSLAAEIVCIGCFATLTGWETRGDASYVSAGFKKTNGGDFTAQNCTAINCDKYGFGNDDTTQGGLLKLQQCISKDNEYNDFRLSPSATGNTGTFDIDECIGETETSAADIDPWGDGTNNQLLSNANIKLNADGSLQSDFTEAVGTGTKWWGTDPRPSSAYGEPYPDTDVDKGGVQSTWSADHPENL